MSVREFIPGRKSVIVAAACALTGLTVQSADAQFRWPWERAPAAPAAPAARPPQDEVPCPPVDIRFGTETLAVRTKPTSTEPGAVRHQLTITQTARDCSLEEGTLRVRVGVAGRVILGPAGAPGTFPVPIRVAVTRGTTTPVYSKLGRLSVTVPPGETSALFTYVDENVAFALPENDKPTNYLVHVGFDEKPEQPQKPARRR